MADKGEKQIKTTKDKDIYNYIDDELKINVLSREVYHKTAKEVHYPRAYEGGQKYKTIKTFTYIGFSKKDLPKGVYRVASFGYGFTKTLYPFANFVDNISGLEQVVFEKGGKVAIDEPGKTLYLNEKAMDAIHSVIYRVNKKYNAEMSFAVDKVLHGIFPAWVKEPENTYVPNALALSLSAWGNSINEFSNDDKAAIQDLFEKLSVGTDFLDTSALAQTRQIIDSKYIKAVIKEFEQILALVTDGDGLEKRWQGFLHEHSWIFSYVFAQPIIVHQREAYVGGKEIDNTDGKFTDFLMKNNLSDNLSFVELKTHLAKLVENTPYRGNDVFNVSKDVTGAIAQVLNQRDNFQKEFYTHKGKNVHLGNMESFNSTAIVLVGSLRALSKEQRASFELFRSNSRDVQLITFDELLEKIRGLQSLVSQRSGAGARGGTSKKAPGAKPKAARRAAPKPTKK